MIANLLSLHAIDDRSHREAAEIWRIVEPSARGIAARFYERLRKLDHVSHLDDDRTAMLEDQLSGHWQVLFTGRFSDGYVKCASMIGINHREVGVDASLYVAACGLLKHDFADAILNHDLTLDQMVALQRTLDQFLFIDMAMITSTYSAWLID